MNSDRLNREYVPLIKVERGASDTLIYIYSEQLYNIAFCDELIEDGSITVSEIIREPRIGQ